MNGTSDGACLQRRDGQVLGRGGDVLCRKLENLKRQQDFHQVVDIEVIVE
jgi:hypothetical protein